MDVCRIHGQQLNGVNEVNWRSLQLRLAHRELIEKKEEVWWIFEGGGH